MNDHSFCRELLRSSVSDMRKIEPFEKETLSTSKSTLGGYEVSGPNRFFYYASYGFIDAMTISELSLHGEYTRYFTEDFERIRGYHLGIDIYLKSQDKQYNHNWTDISTWDSSYKTELCTGPTCTCGGSTRRKLRYSNDEWEYV